MRLDHETLVLEPVLTYRQEIKTATSIPDIELQRNLQSLACAKFKILKKHPPGRDVNATDSFSFNADFTSPLSKIKISTVASRVETSDERRETKDRVEEERRHQTEVPVPWISGTVTDRSSPRMTGLHRPNHEGPQAYDS